MEDYSFKVIRHIDGGRHSIYVSASSEIAPKSRCVVNIHDADGSVKKTISADAVRGLTLFQVALPKNFWTQKELIASVFVQFAKGGLVGKLGKLTVAESELSEAAEDEDDLEDVEVPGARPDDAEHSADVLQ